MTEDFHLNRIFHDHERRWFSSRYFDLIVWLGSDGSIFGFDLCYNKVRNERCLMWRVTTGFAHMITDNGDNAPAKHKATPVLTSGGDFNALLVYPLFRKESQSLPKDFADFVLHTLERHPNYVHRPERNITAFVRYLNGSYRKIHAG